MNYKVVGTVISVIGFADDIVLIAEEENYL